MKKDTYSNTEKDSKNYASGYEVFLNRTNFREVILEAFRKLLKEAVFYTARTSIRILDLGCGNGVMTQKYVETILSIFKDAIIELDIVEPAEGALAEAKKSLESIGLTPSIHCLSAETFVQNIGKEEKFYDIIICSYIFYHVSTDLIRPLTRHLSEHGVMMISMGSHEHPLRKHPSLRAASKHGDSNIIECTIARDLIEKEFKIVKHPLKTDLNLSGLMNNETINDEENVFFSFIYNTDLEKFSPEQMDALKDTIKEANINSHGIVHPIHNIYWLTRSE